MPEPISAGTLLAISALSSLASAGGMAGQGYFQGQLAAEQQAWDKRKTIKEWQERDEDQAFAREQYRDTTGRADRADIQARPGATMSMLAGLKNLGQAQGKATPVDYLSFLAGG